MFLLIRGLRQERNGRQKRDPARDSLTTGNFPGFRAITKLLRESSNKTLVGKFRRFFRLTRRAGPIRDDASQRESFSLTFAPRIGGEGQSV